MTPPGATGRAGTPREPAAAGAPRVGREPVKVRTGSPAWLPVVMFVLLGLGIAVILLNYLSVLPGAPTNWYLLAGLGAILGGIIAATQYR